jgi:hypothetical protein
LGAFEAGVEANVDDLARRRRQLARGALEARAADRVEDRLPAHGAVDAVKVKRGKTRERGEIC